MQIVAIWLKNCYRREKSKLRPKSGTNKKMGEKLISPIKHIKLITNYLHQIFQGLNIFYR